MVPGGIQFSLEIPPNAAAEFKVPTGGVKNPVIVESGVPVWKDGSFQKGVNGVISGSGNQPTGEWSDLGVQMTS